MTRTDLWKALEETQLYISKYYATALMDEDKHDQLKAYIEKFVLDNGYLVDGFTDEELDQIIAKYPFFAKKTLPAGMYEGQTEDVHTVCVQSILVASADLDEDLVYDLTKTLWENQGELSGMLAALNDLSVDKALDGITVDYHPGAIKYYKEIGKM